MREPKDHPLVLEIDGVIRAIEMCPDSPEKVEALLRANRSRTYAIKIITDYEERYNQLVGCFLKTDPDPAIENETVSLFRRLLPFGNKEKNSPSK